MRFTFYALGFTFHASRFTSYLRIHFFILGLIVIICGSVRSAGQRTDLFQDPHPGTHIYRYDWDMEPCALYVAEMDRSHRDLHFEAAIGGNQILGKETVRSMAHRRSQRGDRRVLVAVNGGFGVLGDIRGCGGVLENLHIQDGELMTQPVEREPCLGVTSEGDFLIGDVEMKAKVTLGDRVISLHCINQRREDECESILYTPRMGASTHTSRRGYEIVLTGLQLPIAAKYESEFLIGQFGKGGNNLIPRDGGVLSFRSRIDKNFAAQLREGERGKIGISMHPPIWNTVVQAVGGRLRLVQNGKVNQALEQMHRDEKKHIPGKRLPTLALSHEPRTALGFNDQKLILIVADGRQKGYSTGLSMYELASILVELGATEAINLDGGSSSTFVVDGKVVNRPSGQRERDVLNTVFITVDIGS